MRLLAPLAALAWAGTAFAADVVLSPPAADTWRVLEFPKIARHTSYTVVQSDGRAAFKADADCSASARYLPIDHVDLTRTPLLRWRWKIQQGLPPHNERVKAGDDFAARVYVLFPFDAQHASVWEKLRHRLGASWYGDLVPGNVISYVWSSHEPAGAHWEGPYGAGAQMISLGNGAEAEWTEETVDVVADYTAAVGRTPPPALAIAVMTDTDNTCRQATAYYADFRFVGG
jgi:Protein of unknown function (DUF3047)